MARIAGVEIPKNKKVTIGLTYIFGIGLTSAKKIVAEANIDPEKRIKDLNDEDLKKVRNIVETKFKVEGDLRTEIMMNIRRLKEIGCYRGIRHRAGLPLRGQKTKNNSRTRKGKRKTVAGKKKATK